MARSRITATSNDLITDSGSVLWSFIKGEQFEYPIKLEFIDSLLDFYEYEAVVVEAENFEGQTSPPTRTQEAGVQTVLNVRLPTFRGVWDPQLAYNTGDITSFDNVFYEKQPSQAEGVIDSQSPDVSDEWAITDYKTLYVQFPKTLASTWAVKPIVGSPTYGFFELRVTESSGAFPRTWKPVRGMVEILFSPTHVVPDPI